MHAVSIVCTVMQISTDGKPNYWWTAIFLGRDWAGAMKARRVCKGKIYICVGSCFILKSGRENLECGQKGDQGTSDHLSPATLRNIDVK